MVYNFFCYQSKLGYPDLEEAHEIILNGDVEGKILDPITTHSIIRALVNFNSNLEVFEFDYEQLAFENGITLEEAKKEFNYVEINTSQDDINMVITIYYNMVSIFVPDEHSGDEEASLVKTLIQYTKILRESVGYFVYDPLRDIAFDPLIENYLGPEIYHVSK